MTDTRGSFGIRAAALAGLLVMTGTGAVGTTVVGTTTDTVVVADPPDDPNPSTCCAR
jgi:hypothetical protein